MLKLVKKMYNTQVKQVASPERQCWRIAPYPRRECAEIIDILFSVVHSDLEKRVKLSTRKGCEKVMRVKKDLKHLNPTDLDFAQRTRIFIKELISCVPNARDFGTNAKNYRTIKILDFYC